MKEVKILDTLFRDGMQQEDMEISLSNALCVVKKMADLGFHYGELGFAGSSDFVGQLIESALKEDLGQMKVAAFGRTRKLDENVEDSPDIKEIVRLGVPVAVIVCKSRLSDVYGDLCVSQSDNLEIISDTVKCLKSKGLEVILDLEHAVDAWFGRGNFGEIFCDEECEETRNHFTDIISEGIESGVDCFVVCDSNGGGSPEEIKEMFLYFKKHFTETEFGFHGHNDNELAVANSRAAILSGATHIQGTINGHGERCGNTNLCSFIPRVQVKDGIKMIPEEKLESLVKFSSEVAGHFAKDLDVRSAFVGRNAFTTFAGMHAASEGKSAGSYLQCRPEIVGNKIRIGINSQSGKSNIVLLAKQLGIEMSGDEADIFMRDCKDYINSGAFNLSEASFSLACHRAKGDCKDFFTVTRYHAGTERDNETEKSSGNAIIYVDIDGGIRRSLTDAAFGKGSFDALSQALKKTLIPFYPEIANVHLRDYSNKAVGVLKEETGALVRVLAKFSSNGSSWSTVGVSADQTDAALRAYVAGLRWFLFNLNK